MGKKKQPTYRIVVADSRAPRDGDLVEVIGHYHPLDNPSTIVLDAERTRMWLDRGARPSDRVSKLLAIQGLAEIPAKLQTRIELGQQRAAEAKKAKPREEAEAAAAPAASETAPAEAGAESAPEAAAGEPSAEVSAPEEAASEPAPAESVGEALASEQKDEA